MRSVYSPAAVAAFDLVFRPWMRRRIHSVRITGLPAELPPDRPLLLLPNHVSWWDGFIAQDVQRMLRPAAPRYTVMARDQLARVPVFRVIGAESLDRDSPAGLLRLVRSLEARIAQRPDAVIVLFAQGRIWPSHRRPLGFQRGVEILARRLSPVVIPLAIHIEPLNNAAPTAFVSAAVPVDGVVDAKELERRVEAELDAIHAFVALHGEAAPDQWPGPSGRLPRPDA